MQLIGRPREHGVAYSADFITSLPDTGMMSNPYNAVLVVVDRFSKRVFGYPCSDRSLSTDIATLVEHKLILEQGRGWPLEFRVDGDSLFSAAVFKTLMGRQGVRVTFTSNNHSQGNGLCEKFNGAIEVLIRGLSYTSLHWLSRLPYAINLLNNRSQPSNGGLTAIEIETGRTNLDRLDHAGKLRMRTIPAKLADRMERMEQHRLDVMANQRIAFDIMASQYNKSRTYITPETYAAGKKVWLSAKHLTVQGQSTPINKCDKLRARFYGPYKIKRWVAPATLELEIPRNVWPIKS